MSRNIYSFSVKAEADRKWIEQLRNQLTKEGRNFSFYIVQALRQAKEVEDARRTKV